jgi:hypothetical protein
MCDVTRLNCNAVTETRQMALDVKGYSGLSKLNVGIKSDRHEYANVYKILCSISVIVKLNCTVIIMAVVMMMKMMMTVMTMMAELFYA